MITPVRHFSSYLLFFFLASIAFSSCAPIPLLPEPPKITPSSAIIFVPGYKGSILSRKADGEAIWLTFAEALFGSSPLTRKIPELGLTEGEDLVPTGVLGAIPVFPGIYTHDIYRSFIEFLQRSFPRSLIVPFNYDWRNDIVTNVEELDTLVNNLRISGVKKVSLIGHSMGGLLAAYYLRYGAQDIEAAVENWAGAQKVEKSALIGVPYKGSILVFRDMLRDSTTGYNRKILSTEAVASFASSYQLLPSYTGSVQTVGDVNMSDSFTKKESNWRNCGWGLLRNRNLLGEGIWNARVEYTQSQLSRATRLAELIHRSRATEPPKSHRLMNIVGKGLPTPRRVVVNDTDSCQILLNEDDLKREAPHLPAEVLLGTGDGSLVVETTTLPQTFREAFSSTESYIQDSHIGLLRNTTLQQQILKFLQ